MIKDTAYAFVYTALFVLGMVVVNYTIPKIPPTFYYTAGGIIGSQQVN